MRIARISACAALALTSLVHCLPGDTRPTPGSVLVTVRPSDDIAGGITTVDGWHVVFEKFLLGLGDVTFEDASSCNDYSQLLLSRAGYIRLFDLAADGDPQKLAIAYGLGECSVRFSLRPTPSDVVLASGVGADDLALMQQASADGFNPAAYVQGHASRGASTKYFAWTFLAIRPGAPGAPVLPTLFASFRDCGASTLNAAPTSFVNLQGNDALTLPVVVHGEELFRSSSESDAPLTFDALAAADADGDGTITLAELSQIPAPPLSTPDSDAGGDAGDSTVDAGDAGAPVTYDAFLYGQFLQQMIQLGGAACEVADGNRNE